ncbi:MAG: hypothetical protein A2Z34_03595, partial [Planctomycetes bacterium RBG_16_59_8]
MKIVGWALAFFCIAGAILWLVIPYRLCCIVEGTFVQTPGGPVRVESLKSGDAVWTSSENGTKEIGYITDIQTASSDNYLCVRTTNNEEVNMTSTHTVATDNDWKQASQLTEGMILKTISGQAPIASIREQHRPVKVYMLSVSPNENFYANGFLVHNKSKMAPNWKSAIGTLKHLREMNPIFRNEDSDRNGVNDFWTADVSGLYRVLDAAGNQIAKIEIPVARADGAPLSSLEGYIGSMIATSPQPKAGYYFRSMLLDEKGAPYNQNITRDGKTIALNTKKFAYCAYPAMYEETGKDT